MNTTPDYPAWIIQKLFAIEGAPSTGEYVNLGDTPAPPKAHRTHFETYMNLCFGAVLGFGAMLSIIAIMNHEPIAPHGITGYAMATMAVITGLIGSACLVKHRVLAHKERKAEYAIIQWCDENMDHLVDLHDLRYTQEWRDTTLQLNTLYLTCPTTSEAAGLIRATLSALKQWSEFAAPTVLGEQASQSLDTDPATLHLAKLHHELIAQHTAAQQRVEVLLYQIQGLILDEFELRREHALSLGTNEPRITSLKEG